MEKHFRGGGGEPKSHASRTFRRCLPHDLYFRFITQIRFFYRIYAFSVILCQFVGIQHERSNSNGTVASIGIVENVALWMRCFHGQNETFELLQITLMISTTLYGYCNEKLLSQNAKVFIK